MPRCGILRTDMMNRQVLKNTYGMGFLIVPVLLLTLVISNRSLNRNSALSFTVPCGDGIMTVSCLRNIRSCFTSMFSPSMTCSRSRRVCCCCSTSRFSRSVQLISSRSSWISFCASISSLWSGWDASGKEEQKSF